MDVFENTLINLRVLQSLQCHNRLDTTQTLFKIHTPLTWIPAWAKRWWAAQTRSTDIARIQTLYNDAVKFIEQQHEHSGRLREYLKESLKGLENLKMTYENDPTIVARIDVILDSVNHTLGT
jgi:cation transport regulator ChaC